MAGLVVQTRNPLAPWRDRELTRVDEEISIADWLDANNVQLQAPTICLKNGEAVLRKDWAWQTIGSGDVIAFVELPQGGGGRGSGVLQIVLMLVIVVAAVFTGGAAAGAFGGIATTAGATAGALASGLVMAVGNMLVSMLLPAGNGLSNLQNNQLSAPSPTYSLQAQGNSARLGASIPVIYGLHRVYPDFAAQPYTEFQGNEQYLYQLMCIGQGEYDVLDMRIEDSPISSYEEVSYTLYGPNQDVTAFPTRVEVAPEVAGQELLTGSYVGPFLANAEDTEINQLGIDVIAPSGMYFANDLGTLDNRTAVFQVEVAPWDSNTNAPAGPFVVMLTETFSGASATAIRRSFKINLSLGRYAVRLIRTNAKDESGRAGNSIAWVGMRGYVPGQQNYGGVTTIAMVMRATNNLAQSSTRRVNCKVQRKLKTWHPDTGWSATATPTRSIVWAMADQAKADYGLKLADNRIDLQGFYDLEQYFITRNAGFAVDSRDYCDLVFDNKVSAWDALFNIAQCGRALPVLQGALLRIVRDSPQSIATAKFCARNIVKGSFSINYIMPGEQTADAVIVEWIDKDTLLPKETPPCKLPGSTESKPARVKIQGISSMAHAYREGMTLAAINRYRRKHISFQTELEGHIPSVGDLVAISHPMPNWGVSGELEAVDGLNLTLSEPVIFADGPHFVGLRKPDGSLSGPHLCTAHPGGDPHIITLAAPLSWTPTVADDREHTYFAFGKAGEMYLLARVLPPIRPRGANLVELNCVNEHDAVHMAESGTVPALPAPWQLPKKITKPTIARLDVNQAGTATNPVLLLSWPPAPDADHYLVQTSVDNANWLSHPDTTSTSYSVNVEPGPIWVRVAGVGLSRGNWVTWNGITGIIPPPGNVTGLASVEAFTGSRARLKWNAVNRATYYKIEVWAAGVLRRSSTQTATEYAYSAEDVIRDGGPWRALNFKVWAGNAQGESIAATEVTLSNPQEGALSGVNVYAGTRSAVITYSRPTDTDHAGILVNMDTVAGFTPSGTTVGAGNCIYADNDGVITIPNLVEGVTYYFRLAGFDSFGRDSLTYTGEYSAAISSANMPTPEEIKAGLQTALDTAADPLVFNTDAFAIKLNGIDKTPFIIGNIAGNPAILLDADVAVMGSLSANQIRGGRIAATENIIIGNGNAVINGDGSIITYSGADTLANRDYALLTGGGISFQRYRDGAYHPYKSLKRTEQDTAASGTTVVIPGYWESQPKIQVAAAGIEGYNASAAGQSQKWDVRATNLRETSPGSGRWQFDAVANLNYASNAGTNTVAGAIVGSSGDSFTSPGVNGTALPSNTVSITAAVSFSSVRGNGVNTYGFFYRTVTWYVQGFNGIGWVNLASKARNISAAEHGQQISDTQAANTAGYTHIRVVFIASDTGGQYLLASDFYDRAQNNVSNGSTLLVSAGDPTFGVGNTGVLGMAGPAYSPPLGWEIEGVNYTIEARLSVFPAVTFVSGGGPYANIGAYGYSNSNYLNATLLANQTGIADVTSIDPRTGNTVHNYNWIGIGPWFGGSTGLLPVTSYNPNFWSFNVDRVGGNPYWAKMDLRNPGATIYLRRLNLQGNTTTPSNSFTFQSYAWNVAGAATIAAGTLSWSATGE